MYQRGLRYALCVIVATGVLGFGASAHAKRRARAKRPPRAQTGQPVPAVQPAPALAAEPEPALQDQAAHSTGVTEEVASPPTEPPPPMASMPAVHSIHPALQLRLSIQALHRSFEYRGAAAVAGIDPFEHQLSIAPALGLDFALYPFAFWSVRVLSQLGVRVDYQQLFATQTELFAGTPEQQHVDTSLWQVRAGLRGRVPLRQHEIGVSALFARQRFAIEDVKLRGQRGAALPSVRYEALAVALDTRLRFGGFTLEAELGGRLVADTGELERDWQTVDRAWALDASCALSYRVQRYLDLSMGFSLLRYAITFVQPSAEPALNAEGAVDLQLSGSLALRFVLER